MRRAAPFAFLMVLFSAISVVIPPFANAASGFGGNELADVIPSHQLADAWFISGQAVAREARARVQPGRRARNVILFVGDGMSVSTVTAARIRAGQLAGGSGEEYSLAFDSFPFTALAKTYTVDHQIPDSAGTMTAIVSGVKTRSGILGANENVPLGDFTALEGNAVVTILDVAELRGLSTGIVTTTRITHGTPAALYAKSPDRQWEDDADMAVLAAAARDSGFPDIARQLIEYPHGDGVEVMLGGGRTSFLPNTVADPEEPEVKGRRLDGRDLIGEWVAGRDGSVFVWNRAQLFEIDPNAATRILGLFETEDMEYEEDRPGDRGGEPSLSEMTQVAIRVLSQDPDGFFLMVEGGRIDHAHHETRARLALGETIELSRAVDTAIAMTNPAETLILVTADHGHPLSMSGYARRGNPILGLVETAYEASPLGVPERSLERDTCGLPYTTLSYANGPGHAGRCAIASNGDGAEDPAKSAAARAGCRKDLTNVETTEPRYRQESTVPLSSDAHSGEDVAVYAHGARASMIHGTIEQNVLYHLMVEALAD